MPKRIATIWRERKGQLEALIIPAIIMLVGLGAFGLGRLSIMSLPPAPASPTPAPHADAASGKFVASKNGSKYYLPSCSGAGLIKEENKVWFASVADAQAAGYSPASNCPGL